MSDKELIVEAQEYVDEVWEDIVRDIDYLVQVESVEDRDHAAPGKPFGPAPREAMDRALEVAARLGLKTWDCDGYIGCADLEGESETYVATIAHSDIVPLGTGWSVDPLRVTRRDGYLLGRGVADDKGPLVVSLYAAHFFQRKAIAEGLKLPYTLRCLVGANEETHMEDADYYLEHNPQPAFCFSPDAMFPLICGEKGRFEGHVHSAWIADGEGIIQSFDAGLASNAVPGIAEAVIRARLEDLADAEGIDREALEDGLVRLVAHGKGGHAAMPEESVNALGMLTNYLLQCGLCTGAELEFLRFESLLFADTAGKALGVAAVEPCLGALTCVGGTMRTEREGDSLRFTQSIDMRYPLATSGAEIAQKLEKLLATYGCTLGAWSDAKPFYVSPESDVIRALLTSYWDVTGRTGDAFTIGGGTYSRHFDHAVAFGPLDEADPTPDWVGPEHGADEGVSEEALKRALKVYILAIARLMRLSF